MSAFNGRRAPNVSQYIATLNTLPSAHQLASQRQQQQQQQQEAFGLEDDLALFTNAQFFDFDMGENHVPVDYDPEHEIRARRENAAAHKHGVKGLDFLNCESIGLFYRGCASVDFLCAHRRGRSTSSDVTSPPNLPFSNSSYPARK